jgi:hypothetical protein
VSKDLTWPADRMAKFIDVSPRRLQQLVQEGVVPKEDKNRYSPFKVNLAYIRFLRDRVTSPDQSDSDFAHEKLGKTKAERELLEMELAKERKEVIPRDRVFSFLENVFVAVKMKITGSSMSEIEKDRVLNDLVSLRDADL